MAEGPTDKTKHVCGCRHDVVPAGETKSCSGVAPTVSPSNRCLISSFCSFLSFFSPSRTPFFLSSPFLRLPSASAFPDRFILFFERHVHIITHTQPDSRLGNGYSFWRTMQVMNSSVINQTFIGNMSPQAAPVSQWPEWQRVLRLQADVPAVTLSSLLPTTTTTTRTMLPVAAAACPCVWRNVVSSHPSLFSVTAVRRINE